MYLCIYLCGKERKKKVHLGSEEKKVSFTVGEKLKGLFMLSSPKKQRILIVYPILSVSSIRAREESVLIYLMLVWLSCGARTLQVAVSNADCHFR